MTSFKLTLEYVGTDFAGWVVQPDQRTVEGELGRALESVLGQEMALEVAGRTDAGVHAWGQVASFVADTSLAPQQLMRAANAALPDDVAVIAAERVADGFSARRDARSRTYCYRVFTRSEASSFERGRALWWPYSCNREALTGCAELLPGTHDFTAFTPAQTAHVRFERDVFRAEWLHFPERSLSEFWIEADSFLRQMVRVLVGTMLEVAAGRMGEAEFGQLLEGAPRDRAGPTATAEGLYLASVAY